MARRGGWLLVPVLMVLVAVVLLIGREPAAGNAFTLKVGECFDVPSTAAIGELNVRPCTGPHDGEVFLAQDYPGATGPAPYPGDTAIGAWVDGACVKTAFGAYVGAAYAARPDLKVGYLFPPADAWALGVRRVTCYVAPSNGSKASAPLASGAPAAS